ncbi:unnamed protein product [Ranitomeya imitator]|uniref:Cilia-and flagella-associated protein 96 n=1 Tax=Ranitomeya imitator TaxID=111125 RepID=A0ABN9M460_9NEOB|nr:unnamed protein product [Ranitomeya imitator]
MPSEVKSDMDRIGLFREMGYISIGDKYVTPCSKPFNEAASKNRQMFPGGAKSMANTLGGYFDTQFKRTFEGEAYSDPLRQRRQYRMQQAKKNLGKTFLPSNGEKKPSTTFCRRSVDNSFAFPMTHNPETKWLDERCRSLSGSQKLTQLLCTHTDYKPTGHRSGAGSFYGTLSGPISAFSAEVKPRKAYTAPGKNFYTNPPKQGTGFGYPNLTIGKVYTYSSDNYDISKELVQKEMERHKSKLKAGAFRLNLYPKEYFDINPYRTDKPLPPLKSKKEMKANVKPFKPSSPGKERHNLRT